MMSQLYTACSVIRFVRQAYQRMTSTSCCDRCCLLPLLLRLATSTYPGKSFIRSNALTYWYCTSGASNNTWIPSSLPHPMTVPSYPPPYTTHSSPARFIG